MDITVYTKEACPQCRATKRALKKRGIPFKEINISDKDMPEAEAEKHISFCKSLGYLALPVVYIGKNEHWSGFRPDKIKALASARTPV